MEGLIRLSKVPADGLVFKKSTLYKMHHTKRFPQIFVKIAGALFVDTKKLRELIEECRGS